MKQKLLQMMFAALVCAGAHAQVNSGSDGSDGALDLSAFSNTNIVINMADHPDGIYQYTSVNIPASVTVSFIPNANNTPVVWLVQTDCVINGTINLSGQSPQGIAGGAGGPGGFGGGNGWYDFNSSPSSGLGPGGGMAWGNGGSYATTGTVNGNPNGSSNTYGNVYLIPLIGGSGGGGSGDPNYSSTPGGAGGGGGAILIASSSTITIGGGTILANGANPGENGSWHGGPGSGGAVRLVASSITGSGMISCNGGTANDGYGNWFNGGQGRVRLDALVNQFPGTIYGVETRGFQPIIIPAAGQQAQLAITSIAGIAVSSNTFSSLLNPAVIIPGQQANPIPVVVQCSNIPLNSTITVQVNPTVGATVTATGMNSVGTQASSTATISVNMPHGGGVILATAVTPITFASNDNEQKYQSYAKTGWTADGERFAKVELTVAPGGKQRIVYLTASGKRYPL